MKKALIVIAPFALLVFFAALRILQPVHAQAPQPDAKTFLEGMALDEDGELLSRAEFIITLVNGKGETVFTRDGFPGEQGGLYRFEVKPGIYDMFVSLAPARIYERRLRPVRINGLVIQGGKINALNITMHRGEQLEVIGKPAQVSQPAAVVSEQFDKMQKQIDALKKQVQQLEKK